MTTFTIFDPTNAPDAAAPILAGAQKGLGFVPNLFGTMAGAPTLLKAYTQISELFGSTSFDATQQQVVLMTTSVENDCRYCVAAHSKIAAASGVPADVIAALRDDSPLPTDALEALRTFTRRVVETRGSVTAAEIDAFVAAGHTPAQALEVVLGVGMKVLSNFATHLAGTPLDDAFAPAAWEGRAVTGASH